MSIVDAETIEATGKLIGFEYGPVNGWRWGAWKLDGKLYIIEYQWQGDNRTAIVKLVDY